MRSAGIKAYVLNGVVPELPRGSFVNCHNLAAHYNKAAAAALREVRYWFLDLQPYYPDLNPTEIAFSKLKAHPGAAQPEHLTRYSMRSQKAAICSHPTNAGTSLMRPDMDQIEECLINGFGRAEIIA